MTAYRFAVDSTFDAGHPDDAEQAELAAQAEFAAQTEFAAPAELGERAEFAEPEALVDHQDYSGEQAWPTADLPDLPAYPSSLDGDETPDIPEVPFSVRVASLWGSPTAPPAARPRPTEDEDRDGLVEPYDDAGLDCEQPPLPLDGGDGASGPVVLDEAQAWQRLLRLMDRHPGRLVLGITGEPGAGKTTYADYLAACCVDAAVVGLDGFQLSGAAVTRAGRATRRGAPDTFDLEGYLALLRRLRRDDERTVWAPEFRRDLEEPVAAAVAVRPSTRVVITEGNYLLLPHRQWLQARALCHEVWYVEVPERVRRSRLVGRHRHYGRSKAQASARVTVGVDAENAHVVASTRARADVVVRLALSEDEYS